MSIIEQKLKKLKLLDKEVELLLKDVLYLEEKMKKKKGRLI